MIVGGGFYCIFFGYFFVGGWILFGVFFILVGKFYLILIRYNSMVIYYFREGDIRNRLDMNIDGILSVF